MTTINNDQRRRSSKYLIGTTYGSNYGREEASYCIVEISRETAETILGWMRRFEKGGPLEGAACVDIWNYAATFVTGLDKVLPNWPGDEDRIDDSDGITVDFAELVTHPDSLAGEGDGGCVVRTELDTMSVCDHRVHWSACIKHTDERVESPGLDRAQIEAMIADFAKETP
jgi:hypothetical protein